VGSIGSQPQFGLPRRLVGPSIARLIPPSHKPPLVAAAVEHPPVTSVNVV
jgi:hypothetical protein